MRNEARTGPPLRAGVPLREGMRPGDLAGLVLPLLSVDEYEAKIDPGAVAIGFYVHDQDAAQDLNRFLQKSPVPLLSSEVSPAPDQHGYFLVFVEMLPSRQIGRDLQSLLREVEPLCDVAHWKVRVRKTSELLQFSVETFVDLLRKARRSDEAILDFLRPSALTNVTIKGSTMVFEGCGARQSFRVLGFGPAHAVIRAHNLDRLRSGLGLHEVARCRRLAGMLGDGWMVDEMEGRVLMQRASTQECLLLSR